MDIAAEFCRVYRSFFSLLCPQAVLQEVRQTALCLQLLNAASRLLQDRMDIAAEFCRVYRSFFSLLCPQAVLQEVRQTALCLLINLRGRQPQRIVIQLVYVFSSYGSQGIVPALPGLGISQVRSQLVCGMFLVPPGQICPSLPSIRLGKP